MEYIFLKHECLFETIELWFSVLYSSMTMKIDKLPFDEVCNIFNVFVPKLGLRVFVFGQNLFKSM